MSHGSGSRELGPIARLVQRAWHQKRSRGVLLTALSSVILLAWSRTSSVCPAVLMLLAIHMSCLQQTSDVFAHHDYMVCRGHCSCTDMFHCIKANVYIFTCHIYLVPLFAKLMLKVISSLQSVGKMPVSYQADAQLYAAGHQHKTRNFSASGPAKSRF